MKLLKEQSLLTTIKAEVQYIVLRKYDQYH
uniref:Uncharacterized protein n=1 Tax=Arundo donax TaxID=35708 RepID=A0A0A8Z5M6_ARUDO